MKRNFIISGVILLLIFLLVKSPVTAAPNNHPIFITIEKAEEMISSAVSGLVNTISLLTQRITASENKIEELEQRIQSLESALTPTVTPTFTPTPTPTSGPVILNFGTNITGNGPSISMPSGNKSITFTITPSASLASWAAQVSFDGGTTWYEQHRFTCSGSVCAQVTIPIIGNHYRFSPGSPVSVTVTGELNIEPDAQVILLGQSVSYPFTSSTFSTNGFSTISITASGGDNPQNVTGISLQKFEGGSFVEKQFISCDGGAVCNLQTVPVLGEDYRIVLQGSGTGAMLAAILRP